MSAPAVSENLNDDKNVLVKRLLERFLTGYHGYKNVDFNNADTNSYDITLRTLTEFGSHKVNGLGINTFVNLGRDLIGPTFDPDELAGNNFLTNRQAVLNVALAAEKNQKLVEEHISSLEYMLIREGVSLDGIAPVHVNAHVSKIMDTLGFTRMGVSAKQNKSEVGFAYKPDDIFNQTPFNYAVDKLHKELNGHGANPNGFIRSNPNDKTIHVSISYLDLLSTTLERTAKQRELARVEALLSPSSRMTAAEDAVPTKYNNLEELVAGYGLKKAQQEKEGVTVFSGSLAKVNEAVTAIKGLLAKPDARVIDGVSTAMKIAEADPENMKKSKAYAGKGYQAPAEFNLKITDETLNKINQVLASGKAR